MARYKWKWEKYPESYSHEEKRKILGRMMEIMILTTFRSHFYKWGNKIHQQRKGGQVGLRASGVVAKVVMELWIREMKQRMENEGFEVFLKKKYVDDVLVVCSKTEDIDWWMED